MSRRVRRGLSYCVSYRASYRLVHQGRINANREISSESYIAPPSITRRSYVQAYARTGIATAHTISRSHTSIATVPHVGRTTEGNKHPEGDSIDVMAAGRFYGDGDRGAGWGQSLQVLYGWYCRCCILVLVYSSMYCM